MVENWICIRRFLISIEDNYHNFNLGVWQTLGGTTKCHCQGEGNCMFLSKNMPKSKDRTWKEGDALLLLFNQKLRVGNMSYDSCKFFLISKFPNGFPFLEFMEFYGCLEIFGLNCKKWTLSKLN
jgi:hypothetical protein